MAGFANQLYLRGKAALLNYLSHFHLFSEKREPLFSLGKVLPDLLRTFGNIKQLKPVKASSPQLALLYQGIEVHLQADSYFHNSTFFKQNMEKVKAALLDHEYESIKKYFFFYAHILLELLLDRILLKEQPEVAAQFYKDLNMVDEVTIGRFFEYNGWESKTQEFLKFFHSFKKSRYLYGYADNEGLIYALERINIRVGLHRFAEQDKVLLRDVVVALEEVLKPGYSIIFQEIEQHINFLDAH